MLTDIAIVAALTGIAMLALVGSNYLSDLGIPSSTSRYLAPLLGGLGFLAAVLVLQVATTIALAIILTGAILLLRLGFRHELRGLRGSLPGQSWSELTFAVAATLALTIGWGLLGDQLLAFLPIGFMAWGDSTAGVARATLWRNSVESCWPSLLMLAVCLAIGALYQPAWIGFMGAVTATAAERWRPRALNAWDDNLHLVTASFTAMGILSAVSP